MYTNRWWWADNGTKRRDSKQIVAPNRDKNPARSERHAMSLWRLALEPWPRLVGVNNACVAGSPSSSMAYVCRAIRKRRPLS